jgi:integrase
MRKDSKGNPLPTRMHEKHGRYYHVRNNKWRPLSKDYYRALMQVSSIEAPSDQWSQLVDAVYRTYERRHKTGDLAENTLKQYQGIRTRIEYGFAEFTPEMVETSDITTFLDLYEDTPNIANRMLTVIKAIFEKAVRQGICKANPAYSVKRFEEAQRDRYLTDAEYRAIWAAANPQTRLIMDLCYMTAARISDVLAIKHADITSEGIYIRQAKSGARQMHAATPEIRDIVAQAKALHRVQTISQYLFHPKGKAGRYGYRAIHDSFQRATKKAGVQDARLHDIRAKSATDAEQEGLDPQKLLGHSNPAMTNRYLRLKRTEVVSGPAVRRLHKTGSDS